MSTSLKHALQSCLTKDIPKLQKLHAAIKNQQRQNQPTDQLVEKWQQQLTASQTALQKRQASLPSIRYPDLPVAEQKSKLLSLIKNHQVIILAGETGSGKTTQLPKLCLEAGRGMRGLIGHTQPRRLAARSVAQRIADELQVPLGKQVGYQVRFNEQVEDITLVKLMTDGILLAETRQDPDLLHYDTIIIDEAHERSLNIDFLLGYLKKLLPRRPDLILIITSATIDVGRFSQHFNDAPVIEVSGRTFPVDVWYRPLFNPDNTAQNTTKKLSESTAISDQNLFDGVEQALQEIEKHERQQGKSRGDVLIFLSGEKDIRDLAQFLRKLEKPQWQILPLYGRLSFAEQQKVFDPARGNGGLGRRIVLATNVAETSVTVPGIGYVIDPGMARISRYSYRSKVQRLPIEAISQASANQRKGRCGRVSAGICIRLYVEDDFNLRPEFSDPEILRTNLASVILQMQDLRLGEVADFPFIDMPDSRFINDGIKLLQELGALDQRRRITALGQQIARLPVDPRIARMIIAAAELGSLKEVLIIASALTIQDPRERPQEKQQAADQKHQPWRDEKSDFVTLLNIWHDYEQQRQTLSQNKLRQWAAKHFLSYLRMREWREVHRQLLLMCQAMKLHKIVKPQSASAMTPVPKGKKGINDKNANNKSHATDSTNPLSLSLNYEAIHCALLTGLLGNIGQKHESGVFMGPRQRQFHIFPGSAVYKKPPTWVMAAELVETSRLFARTVAAIEPAWVEQTAGNLLKYSYSEPRWHKRQGRVLAMEQVSLYGLILVSQRRVGYSSIDADVCQQLLIMEGLVTGNLITKGDFLAHNLALIENIEKLEAKTRRRDILVDDQVIYEFYQHKLALAQSPITTAKGFETWRKKQEQQDSKILFLTQQDLMREEGASASLDAFPDTLQWQGMQWPLSYQFQPGNHQDGVTIRVPYQQLQRLPKKRLTWLVPGLLKDKIEALLRGLPKSVRKSFVPVPHYAQAIVEALEVGNVDLLQAVAKQLQRLSGRPFDIELLQTVQLDDLYYFGIALVDEKGKVVSFDRDLDKLLLSMEQLPAPVSAPSIPSHPLLKKGLTVYPDTPIPTQIKLTQAGMSIPAWPTFKDTGAGVDIVFSDSLAEANNTSRAGLIRFYRLVLDEQLKHLTKQLSTLREAELLFMTVGEGKALAEQVVNKTIELVFLADHKDDHLLSHKRFVESLAKRGELEEKMHYLIRLVVQILSQHQGIRKSLKGTINLAWATVYQDIGSQLDQLIHKQFVQQTPVDKLADIPRYLKAIEYRLTRFKQQLSKENMWVQELQDWQAQHKKALKNCLPYSAKAHALHDFYWQLQEYRVSLFAQQLGTKHPVSAKRLQKQWQQISQLDVSG